VSAAARSGGVLEYEPGDLTIVVDGALPLAELQAVAAEHGQRLALDPPGSPTLAQCLLEDLSGPLRHRFGTMRDLILGVSVVLGDGSRASAGGKVVKNVAGYDLGKLFCGSRGRLGAVERLALRLHPAPSSRRSVTIAASRWLELHHSTLVPSAADILGEQLHVMFEGPPRVVDAALSALGGEEADGWQEIRELQARLPGRRRWRGEPAPLVRPGPAVAYTEQAPAEHWSPLAERVREALWTSS
jgi:glycolate oxidase FAD binding subunit